MLYDIHSLANCEYDKCECEVIFVCECVLLYELCFHARDKTRRARARDYKTAAQSPRYLEDLVTFPFASTFFVAPQGYFFFISLARTLPTRTDVMSRAQSRRFFSSMPRSRAKKRNSRKLNLSHVNARESNSTLTKLHKQ